MHRDDTVGRPFSVEMVSYHYAICLDNQVEVLVWQWHPSHVQPEMHQLPHLHIGAPLARSDFRIALRDIHKLHLPTGSVTLPMFVRMLIEEFGVEPLHEDWDERLRTLETELASS